MRGVGQRRGVSLRVVSEDLLIILRASTRGKVIGRVVRLSVCLLV